jgi:hypothetical protein
MPPAGGVAGWARSGGETHVTNPGELYDAFQGALNAELADLGCRLRVAPVASGPEESILLLDESGHELGWVPEQIDAPTIAAFETILAQTLRRSHPFAVTKALARQPAA